MPKPSSPVAVPRPLRILILVPILLMVALSAWAVASPVGGAPDENFHIASIYCGAGDREGLCESEAGKAGKLVPWGTVGAQCFAFHPEVSAECQKKVLGDDPNRLVLTEHVNATAHYYSPVYYAVMSVFASDNIPASVIIVRLVNGLIFVAVTTLLYLALPARRRRLLVVASAVSLVPWGIFLTASVNPNGWAVLAGCTLWLAVLGFFETTGKRKIALGALAAVITVIGAGARSDMAVYAVLGMVAALLLAARRGRGRAFWLSAILPASLAIVCFILFLSAQQIGVWQNGAAPGSGGTSRHGWSLLAHNLLNVPSLWVGSLGTWPLGWNDVTIPPFVWVGTIFAASAAVFVGLSSVGRRKLLVLAVTAIALGALPLYLLQRSETEVGGLVHPRYLLPLLIMFIGFALFPARHRAPTATRFQVWLIVPILAIANAISLYSDIRRYTLGTSPGVSLSAPGSWWWASGVPAPNVVFVVGAVAFAGTLILLAYGLLHRTRRRPIPMLAAAAPEPAPQEAVAIGHDSDTAAPAESIAAS